MKLKIVSVLLLSILVVSCVSKKKYKSQMARVDILRDSVEMVIHQLDQCLADKQKNKTEIENLESEILRLKATSNALLNQMSELSVITKTQAESIKKSLENLSSKDAYIKDLQIAMARKDSMNLALVMNLKGALVAVSYTHLTLPTKRIV